MHILTKNPRSETSAGFTVIETLIVLVIAGLFLLVVFEAIPALTRSSRNHSRKQDVQAVLEAISQYELNNSGNLPGVGSNFLQYYQLNYYEKIIQYGSVPANGIGVYISGSSAGPTPPPPVVAPDTSPETVIIHNYEKCSTTTPGGAVSVGAGYSDVVAQYAVETSTNTAAGECEQL